MDFDPVAVNALKAGNPIPGKFADRAAHYRENPDRALAARGDLFASSRPLRGFGTGADSGGWEVKAITNLLSALVALRPAPRNPPYWEGGTNPF